MPLLASTDDRSTPQRLMFELAVMTHAAQTCYNIQTPSYNLVDHKTDRFFK